MKSGIHPAKHRPVIFHDVTSQTQFLVNSTVDTTKRGVYTDGNEYDVYEVEISSASHPFYTGEMKNLDAAGRADRFRTRASKARTTVA